MSLSPSEIRELQLEIADRLYIQVGGWHLYLGDAGVAEALAIECAARLDQGAGVPIGGGSSRLPLARLVPPGQLQDLEDLLANRG